MMATYHNLGCQVEKGALLIKTLILENFDLTNVRPRDVLEHFPQFFIDQVVIKSSASGPELGTFPRIYLS